MIKMGKSTIPMAIFNSYVSYVKLPEGLPYHPIIHHGYAIKLPLNHMFPP